MIKTGPEKERTMQKRAVRGTESLTLRLMVFSVCALARVAYGQWPSTTDGLLFKFQTTRDEVFALDENGSSLYGVSLEPHRLAHVDRNGRLLLRGGYFLVPGVGEGLHSILRKSGMLSLEAWIVPERVSLDSSGSLITFGDESVTPNLALIQEKDHLYLLLRTSQSKEGSLPTKIDLFRLESANPLHLAVTYRSGRFECFKNGESVEKIEDKVVGDFSNWMRGRIVLGNSSSGDRDWPGVLEGVAVFSRVLESDEVQRDYEAYRRILAARKQVPVLRIRGKLKAKSPVPSIEELSPYTQSLSVYEYEVEKVLEGEYDGKTIYVAHWCVLDSKQLAFKDAPIGKIYDLTLEPFEENPQLESENLQDDVIEDFSLPLYYDAGGLSLGFAGLNVEQGGGDVNIESNNEKEKTSVSIPPQRKFIPPEKGPSKPDSIQKDLVLLDREAEKFGGWEKWKNALEPLRKEVRKIVAEAEKGKSDCFVGLDDFLFSRGRAAYLLVTDLLHRPRTPNLNQPDSPAFKTIVSLSKQLAEREVDLIVVPVPPRSEIYPDKMNSNVAEALPPGVPVAPQRKEFIRALLAEGVESVDLLPFLMSSRTETEQEPLYSRTDPHWARRGINIAADVIAKRLERYSFVQERQKRPIGYSVEKHRVQMGGALFKNLPEQEKKTYWVKPTLVDTILAPGGGPYEDVEDSPVLIVGDSYAEHFRKFSAGISAQLAYRLGFPMSLEFSAGGGPKVPRMLARKGKDFINCRKVIIWIFVARYLTPGRDKDWRPVKLP